MTRPRPRGWWWLVAAATAGLLYGGARLYWAGGGTWLADTATQWALDWRTGAVNPGTWVGGLAAGAFALSPLLITRERYPRTWGIARPGWWLGAVGLLAYGGAQAIFAHLALGGFVTGAIDRTALLGHALLWEPLLFGWGLALLAGLWRSRYRGSFSDLK